MSRFAIFRRLRLGGSSRSASTRHERSRRRRVGASLLGGADCSRCAVEGLLERARFQLTVGSDLSALSDASGLALSPHSARARYSAARLLLAGPTTARLAGCCMQRPVLVQRRHGIINWSASCAQGHQVVVRTPAAADAYRSPHQSCATRRHTDRQLTSAVLQKALSGQHHHVLWPWSRRSPLERPSGRIGHPRQEPAHLHVHREEVGRIDRQSVSRLLRARSPSAGCSHRVLRPEGLARRLSSTAARSSTNLIQEF